MSSVPFHTSHRAGTGQGRSVDPGCRACASELGPRRYCPAGRPADDEEDLARSYASVSAYVMTCGPGPSPRSLSCWLVPGLTDDGDDVYEIGARSIFPEARPGRRANWLPSGPRLLPIPRMGSHGIASLELGGKGSTCRGQHAVAQQAPRFARGCPSTVGREGVTEEEERCRYVENRNLARDLLSQILTGRSGTVLAQVPNKQLGRTSDGI
ncbi:hypothetical protein B0T18DRAFT_18324 [Schizothecium vesticola]|uniref:Uncharacterized protein n=1 Tax=Schizothecium vesticola TaxID=314040 RepID=A0AA40KC75_9PEZI|nr:hypothetical protein B0T18DRAFT_18324 [Schizothecium vesticola]